jgi:hypothetical protein
MLYQRVPARRHRPSDPIPAITFVSRYPLTERLLSDPTAGGKVDFVVRLVRTAPGDERNRALVRALRVLSIRVPSTLRPRVTKRLS